jgi:hypothetical protein
MKKTLLWNAKLKNQNESPTFWQTMLLVTLKGFCSNFVVVGKMF